MQEGIIISIFIEEIMAGTEQFDWLREIMKKTWEYICTPMKSIV
jgi:hypothetical protein